MASDFAEFLKNQFLVSYQEAESGLSLELTSIFNDIRKEFTEEKKGFWSSPPQESIFDLHDLEHALAECQVQKPLQKTLKKTFTPSFRDPKHDVKSYLEKIKENLINIRTKAEQSSLSTPATLPTGRHTDLDVPNAATDILEFEEHENKIVKWLSGDDGFKAIGIFGMCGTGKTTLVRKVFNPSSVHKFKPIIWVCLSDLTTKEEVDIKIINHMLHCLGDDTDKLTEDHSDEELVRRLHWKLKADYPRYLVVLDDVWHCNEWFNNLTSEAGTDKLRFSSALPKDTGGAVIVTSRLKDVTRKLVGREKLIHLMPWNDEKVRKIITLQKSSHSFDRKTLDEVVYHCHGLPLVAEKLSDFIAQQIQRFSSED